MVSIRSVDVMLVFRNSTLATVDRIDPVPCENVTVKYKLTLLVIGKCEKQKIFKDVTYLPIVYDAQIQVWVRGSCAKAV